MGSILNQHLLLYLSARNNSSKHTVLTLSFFALQSASQNSKLTYNENSIYLTCKEALYKFERTVISEIDNKEYTVRIDFLTPRPPKGEGSSRRHRQLHPDLKARNLPGAEIALQLNHKVPLEGILPGDGRTSVEFKMADLTSLMTLKGIAFSERYQEKDAYDIYALCDYYEEGPVSVAREIKPNKDIGVVKKGLDAIKQRFRDINAEGPSWIVNFLAIANDKEKEDFKQRSFTVVNEMLKSLSI